MICKKIFSLSFLLSSTLVTLSTPVFGLIPSPSFSIKQTNKLSKQATTFQFAEKKNLFRNEDTLVPSHSRSSMTMLNLSGGASIANALSSSLQSGPYGIPALAAIAATVLTPLTLYRQAYSFSVGYGYSMAAMGISLLLSFPNIPNVSNFLQSKSPSFWLAASLVFYGARLGSFILLRNVFVKSKSDKFKEMDKSTRLKRIPFALNVSLFYSFLACPALYALRSGLNEGALVWTGVYAAWIGAILEAVADTHKFIVKRGKDQAADFAGPTGGLYAISRHPNYLFEVVYWLGLFLGGVSSFGKNPVAWICSLLGVTGITFIMTSATKRLDKQQEDRYAGQELYDSWKTNVPYPLVPFLK